MPYRDALKEAFATNAITRVAIIDDAFDDFDVDTLDRDAITPLQTELRELDGDRAQRGELAAEIEALTGRSLNEVADSLRDRATLEALWPLFRDADPLSGFATFFRVLFAGAGANLRDKLRPLRALKELLLEIEGVEVEEFGSETEAAAIKDHQLVFLDYYLNGEVPEKGTGGTSRKAEREGREKSIDFLSKLVEARPDNLPVVMLISSRASPNDLPDFRQKAKMLASKMNFLPKDFALSDLPRAQHSIMRLVKHTKHADALVSLLKTWSDVVAEASESMMISLRELDLTDYSYIQQYRLAGEKTPLGQYIAWLFNGRLTDLVETQLREKKIGDTVGEFTLPSAIPGRTSPTKAISELFSSITTTRIPIGDTNFAPPAWSGDIFLETSVFNKIHGSKHATKIRNKGFPDVLTVVTPACDLVPNRAINNPLKTITMIGGTLKPLADASEATSDLLMLKGEPYVIEWNTKWPITVPVENMSPLGGPNDRYQWVGRYRDIYHAELQHRLLQDLGRPALPIPPTMPHWIPVRVLARTVKRPSQFEMIMDHSVADQMAWTWLGKGSDRMFALREEMVWTLRAAIIARCATLGQAETKDLQDIIDAGTYVDNLQLPMVVKRPTAELACGASVAKAADTADISTGTKPLVIIFGNSLGPAALAA